MSLSLVPAGSVITRVYWAVPRHDQVGETYDNFVDAGEAATRLRLAAAATIQASYPDGFETLAAKAADGVRAVVDLRWVIQHPGGSTTDTVVERTDVSHLGLEHWEKCRRWGTEVR